MPKCKVSRTVYRNAQKSSENILSHLQIRHDNILDNLTYSETNSSKGVVIDYDKHSSLEVPCYSNAYDKNNDPTEELCNNNDENNDSTEKLCNSMFVLDEKLNQNFNCNFKEQLADWAINYKIPLNALNSLLGILKPYYSDLPFDSRTLLNTPRNLNIEVMEPGHYYHFGLNNAIKKLLGKLSSLDSLQSIDICINIDGLPISKSSNNQLYPILCNLFSHPNNVEIIGLYQGYNKPADANQFLNKFTVEAIDFCHSGFSFNNKLYSFKVVAIICDVPAKSFVTFTKGHSGYNSCSKCHIEGEIVNNRICFPQMKNLRVRTDGDFRQKVNEDHHTGTSILENLPKFDMIRSIPLDYMHLICLGVMKKLLYFWVLGKPPTKLPYNKISIISASLKAYEINMPCEFARKPRSLTELKRFKATEFRQILFYTGPLVLKAALPADIYLNYLCLHVAMTIFSNHTLLRDIGDYGHSLTIYFLKSFITLYGKENVSHNVHNLLHIYADTQTFGILQDFSAFPFENYLQTLKFLIRKQERPLQQIVKRKIEFDNSIHCTTKMTLENNQIVPRRIYFDGPIYNYMCDYQYKEMAFSNFTLKLSERDSCCCLKNKSIIVIHNFIKNNTGIYIIGQKFMTLEDLYVKPCRSSELGIFIVSNLGNTHLWNINEVDFKYVKLPFNQDKFVVIPLLHTLKKL